jgi:hypothetical protein
MKIFLCILLMLQYGCLTAQTKADSTGVVVTTYGIDRVKQREEKIKAFADSINDYDGGTLPAFLLDSCFDSHATYLWNGFHDVQSIRWRILKLVNNKHALELLLQSNNARLRAHCNWQPENVYPNIVIPLVNVPVYQLIERRCKELQGGK